MRAFTESRCLEKVSDLVFGKIDSDVSQILRRIAQNIFDAPLFVFLCRLSIDFKDPAIYEQISNAIGAAIESSPENHDLGCAVFHGSHQCFIDEAGSQDHLSRKARNKWILRSEEHTSEL